MTEKEEFEDAKYRMNYVRQATINAVKSMKIDPLVVKIDNKLSEALQVSIVQFNVYIFKQFAKKKDPLCHFWIKFAYGKVNGNDFKIFFDNDKGKHVYKQKEFLETMAMMYKVANELYNVIENSFEKSLNKGKENEKVV
jgi:hypothetical protein